MKMLVVFRYIAFILVCILFFVGISRALHNPRQIGAEITGVTSKTDNVCYYVYFDYKLSNQSMKEVDSVYVSASFRDESGTTIGTLTSKFTDLSLNPGETVRMSSYLSERQGGSLSKFFIYIYQNGIKGLTVTYDIVYIRWTDGKTSGSSWRY